MTYVAYKHTAVCNPGMRVPMPRLQIISALYPAVIVLHGRRASSDVGAEGFGPRCSGSVRSFAAPLPAKALASKTCLVSGWPQTPSCDDQASEGIFWRQYDARRSTRLDMLSVSMPTPNKGALSDGPERAGQACVRSF